jgi:hypothetical protein
MRVSLKVKAGLRAECNAGAKINEDEEKREDGGDSR